MAIKPLDCCLNAIQQRLKWGRMRAKLRSEAVPSHRNELRRPAPLPHPCNIGRAAKKGWFGVDFGGFAFV